MKLFKICVLAAAAVLAMPLSAKEHLKSVSVKALDKSVPASQDFYRHVNNAWMKSHPLTSEYARYGVFNILEDSSNNRVRRIVTNLASTKPAKGTDAYKIAAIYELAMDSTRRNALGAKPIRPLLDRIENAKPAEMGELFMWMQDEISSPLVGVGPMEDLADSRLYAMYVSPASLTLGDRDYYLKNDKSSKEIRAAYQRIIEKAMKLSGYSKKDAARIAKNVIKIETLMADSTWTREQSRNMPAMYNPRTVAQLKKDYPHFDWDNFTMKTLGIPAPERMIVTNPNTVKQADNLMASLTDREKKDLYAWQLVETAANTLSDDYQDIMHEFQKVMTGVEKAQPRWKRALGATEGIMGEGIGKLYVEKFFPASSKEYMIGLVENLRTALGKHIINLPWMSDDTKLQAIKKLNAITVKIGYPDKWKDYSELIIDPELSYWDNMHAASLWAKKQQLKKWGKPVDRSEWGMTPQTINAYYNPINNEIVFPAGILQAPFFDPEASDAENYGGIGVVIGHELTHGFDDQGCNFDAEGNMTNWWTAEDAKAFAELTQGLARQFDQVEVLPGLNANGQFTLGENIADQGGLRISRTAFLDSQKKKGVDIESEQAVIDGVKPMQAFYLNYANLWAQNIREAEMRRLTIGDPHSLGNNRVNVSLRNIEPFFEAFGIKEGDKMWRPVSERVIIW